MTCLGAGVKAPNDRPWLMEKIQLVFHRVKRESGWLENWKAAKSRRGYELINIKLLKQTHSLCVAENISHNAKENYVNAIQST